MDRKRTLDALAAADAAELARGLAALGDLVPKASAVRGPEVGMVMLRGRIGGGGAPFNVGEATVTRATVKLDSGEIGHSIILGRDTRKAQIVAHLDALAQHRDWSDRIEDEIVQPAIAAQTEAGRIRAEETEATRVDFFTMVRGED